MQVLSVNELLDVKQDKLESLFNILILKECSGYVIIDQQGQLRALLSQDFINLSVSN